MVVLLDLVGFWSLLLLLLHLHIHLLHLLFLLLPLRLATAPAGSSFKYALVIRRVSSLRHIQ
jgi:hypothetical protein